MGISLAKREQSGFTIVELLIVVVVIGVLAAIVVVAYNGITQSARDVRVRTAVRQTARLFEAYLAKNGSYPTVANSFTCLSGYNSSGQCRFWSSTYYDRDPDLEAALATVGKIPDFPRDLHQTYYGLTLRYDANDTYNSQPARYSLSWKVKEESHDCGPGSVKLTGDTWTDAPYHTTDVGYTYCYVLLPDPGT